VHLKFNQFLFTANAEKLTAKLAHTSTQRQCSSSIHVLANPKNSSISLDRHHLDRDRYMSLIITFMQVQSFPLM